MNNYKFKAKTLDGQTVKGSISAEDEKEFYSALRERDLYCEEFTVTAVTADVRRMRKMKTKELVVFCRKFGTMLNSGLSITAALEVMYESAEQPHLKKIYLTLYESLQTGAALSDTMRTMPGVFSRFFISMVESGEESGALDTVFLRMCTHYEKENRLHASVRAAVAYPTILFCLAFVVVILLFTFVMPPLFAIFEGQEVPPVTQFMMGASQFFVQWWYLVIIGVLLLVVFFKASGRIPGVNYAFAAAKLKLPVLGKMNLMIYTARLSRAISMLYSSGVSLITTLGISCNVLNNVYVTRKFTSVVDAVMSGEPLSGALDSAKIFDSMFISMIKVGEESGNLEDILEHTADYYDLEADVAVKRMITLLEPLLLVILGIIIALILVSVLLPIYSMYQGMA